jgi:solute carrier family 25 (mitochondrial phosphate transporter), member 3
MAKFAVQGKAAEVMFNALGKRPNEVSQSTSVGVSLASGVVAGVVMAVISHPAETLLLKIERTKAGGDGSVVKRATVIAKEMGFVKLCLTGLGTRCVIFGALAGGQFGIFDYVMSALGASTTPRP